MRTGSVGVGVIVGFISGAVVSIPITFVDWRLNPSGLFHDEHGTNWAVVAETFWSWFWPVALGALATTMVICYWLAVRATRHQRVQE